MNREHENAIQFIESGEVVEEAFQSPKQPFNLVTLLVHLLVIVPPTQAIAFRRYDRKHLKFQYQLTRFIAFIGFVHNDMRAFPAALFGDFSAIIFLPAHHPPDQEKARRSRPFWHRLQPCEFSLSSLRATYQSIVGRLF
jgi:hypothetical protein